MPTSSAMRRSRLPLANVSGGRRGFLLWTTQPPQTGKVTCRTKSGGIKQVDFLSGVAGLDHQGSC